MSTQFQDFDDAESDTGDFNPAAEASDNEDAQDVKRAEPAPSNNARSVSRGPSRDNAEDDVKAADDDQKPDDVDGASAADDDDVKSDDANDEKDDAGEDDEGPGEDIGNNDDDDEDDEDEDEDEDVGPTRKRRKQTRNQFIDVEAEVDDEDEEQDDEDDEEREEFVADTHPDDEGLDAAAERDDRRHRELDMQRQRNVEIDAEKEAERFRKKYGRNQAAAINSAVTPQSYLVPSVDDPSIWSVKCKLGKEREVVFALMKRIQDRMGTREQLDICSAFERSSSIPGHFYVEAFRQTAVTTACENLPGAYPRTGMFMVPIGEMPDLLRVRKTETVEVGKYVRVKRGKYAGDIAQVADVMENGLEVELKLVPRLDYGAAEDADAHKRKRPGGGAAPKSAIAGRPPARLFSESEAQKRLGKYLQQGNSFAQKEFTFMGDQYHNGFLIKAFKINYLETENVDPTLEEVAPFQESSEGGGVYDLQALQTARKQQKSNYLVGDRVEVWQGEQQGASGTVISTQGDIVSLKVTEGNLKGQTIEAPSGILRKYFQVGNHVTIIGGTYTGETGFVERIKDERVSIITDATQKELTVFSKDLREADEAISMPPSVQAKGYDVHDLVRMDNATVGVIVKTDRDTLRILDQFGTVQNKPKSGIQQKIERKRFDVSIDRDGAEIRLDDSVKEVVGAQRQGIVMHMNRGFLFMKDRSRLENAGMFVARNNNVISMAAQRKNGVPNGAARPPGAGGMAPPLRTFGRDRYVGKTCTIRRGAYKGLIGIVKDATENDVRLELQGKQKIISMNKEFLKVIDPETGETIQMPSFGGPRPAPTFAHRPAMDSGARGVPSWDGSRTPAMNGGRTPGWAGADGGRTPAWAGAGGGNKTPAWKSGSRTVNARNDGSRTAYGGGGGGDGSRTSYGGATAYGGASTWNPNNSTPFHPSSFGGSRTPAAGAYGSAATPGAFAADTPGATMGYGGNYATPGAGATPGAYAQTPGASGLADDGYAD